MSKPTCYWCKHPHYWGVPCAGENFYPGWLTPTPCHCARGASRARIDKRPARAVIPAAVRAAVIARDGRLCTICGCNVYIGARAKRWPRRRLTLDHITHYSLGGADTIANLRVVCQGCNSRRGAGELPGWFLGVRGAS